jgi:hypothetical protein
MNAPANDEKIKGRISESRKVASHAPVTVMAGAPAQQVPEPERVTMCRYSDPLAYAIHTPVWRAQVNDDFSH